MALEYTCEITINKPLEEVVSKMDNPNDLKHWQPGFISLEHLEGDPGQKGAKSLLTYQMGRRKVEMIETIIRRDLPGNFDATYEAKGVWNEQCNSFERIDENTTKWVSRTTFEMKGFMKLMQWLMPGAFKKQSQKYLEYFKAFVEDGKSQAES